MLSSELDLSGSQSIHLSKKTSPPRYQSLIRVLFCASGILMIIHLLNYLAGWPSWQIERLFHLELEANIPTWFSAVLWLAAAYSACLCSQYEMDRQKKRLWAAATFMSLFFSMDEVAVIHEHAVPILGRWLLGSFGSRISEHFRATDWPILAAPVALVAFPVVAWGLVKAFSGSRKALYLAASGFFILLLGGWGLEMTTNFLNHAELEWLWQIEATFEEGLEMAGAILIANGFFTHQHALENRLEG